MNIFALFISVSAVLLRWMALCDGPVHASLIAEMASSNMLVAFVSTQCQFSQHFLPVWKEFEKLPIPTVGTALKTRLVNCAKETDLCIVEQVKFYPSLRFYSASSAQTFKGKRSVQRLVSFVAKAQLVASQAAAEAAEAAATADGGVVSELGDSNFDSATSGGAVFVKFYTKWCPHCREVAPLFARLPAALAAAGLRVSLASVDCERQQETCSAQQVAHYPQLALYASGRRVATHEDEHSVESWLRFLRQEIDEFQRRRLEPARDGGVEIFAALVTEPLALTELNFDTSVASATVAFVEFFAPWCVHCQRLAPVWSQLTQAASSEFGRSVLIGAVDCTQQPALCNRHEVKGYPTLLLLRAGAGAVPYAGRREFTALLTFLRNSAAAADGAERDEL